MTQEKQLLIKDLCSRLPYGVKEVEDAENRLISAAGEGRVPEGAVRMGGEDDLRSGHQVGR